MENKRTGRLVSLRGVVRTSWAAVTAFFFVLGLVDAPDQAGKWRVHIGTAVEWLGVSGAAEFFAGDGGRWLFCVLGVALAVAWPLVWRKPSASPPPSGAGEGTGAGSLTTGHTEDAKAPPGEPNADRVGREVWVTWEMLTPVQMRLRIQNDTAKTINGVQIEVTDVGLVSERHGTRVQVPSTHHPNGRFLGPYTLLDARKVLSIFSGPDHAKKMPFLRREGANMHQTGYHGPTAKREVQLPDRGEWEFDLKLTWAEGQALTFQARVRWTGEEIQPLFLKALSAWMALEMCSAVFAQSV